MDLPAKEVGCHHTGFAKKCRALVTSGACNRWVHIMGTNPNTGEPVSKYDCVDNWGPVLMIENSQQQRCTAASVDKASNEIAGVKQALAEINHTVRVDRQQLVPSRSPNLIELNPRGSE